MRPQAESPDSIATLKPDDHSHAAAGGDETNHGSRDGFLVYSSATARRERGGGSELTKKGHVMSVLYDAFLLFCASAGVVSEIITIAVPEKIVGMLQRDPEEIVQQGFYRFVFVLSAFYLMAIILMFFSAFPVFRIYGVILLVNSLLIWIARKWILQYRFFQVAESTICLILLLDVVRKIGRLIID